MDVAIAGADFDNQEAYKTYPMDLPSPLEDWTRLHRYCYDNGIACGFIHSADDLSRIKLIYILHWVMWKNEWDANVEAFVRNGGKLVVGAMTGTRDENNHIPRPSRLDRDSRHSVAFAWKNLDASWNSAPTVSRHAKPRNGLNVPALRLPD